jgi:hypothetical protein
VGKYQERNRRFLNRREISEMKNTITEILKIATDGQKSQRKQLAIPKIEQ